MVVSSIQTVLEQQQRQTTNRTSSTTTTETSNDDSKLEPNRNVRGKNSRQISLNDGDGNGEGQGEDFGKYDISQYWRILFQAKSDSSLTLWIVHHLLRLLVLCLCIIGCMGQIISIINMFFSYPAIVFVDLHQMERLTLPGITICNNNRVMRSKLNEFDAKFAYKWTALMNRSSDGPNSHQFKLYQQQLIDNLIRNMMSNLTVAQFMSFGNAGNDFLDVGFFRCASDKNHPNKKCIYLSNLFTTAQDNGNCFTLFHKSNSTELEEIAIESGLSESAVVRGNNNESVDIEMSLRPFAPNEIMRFRVNFQGDEYTTLNEPISGRFIIHDNKQIAVIREKSYRIIPGRYYIFYMVKYTDKLLPAPYVTDCRDYERTGQQNDGSMEIDSDNILFQAPASKANCVIGCMAKKTIETCNCWPPELPFFFNKNENASENSLKWCDWREKPPIENGSWVSTNLTWFQYCFNMHENECNGQCKPDCSIDRYRIISEEIDWPFQERIEHSDDSGELRKLKSCCAVISIRYWSAEQKINQYKPRFEVAEFTSNIGGLLSMWLGFSLFGFYNLNEKFMVRLINHCLWKRKAKRKLSIIRNKSTGISATYARRRSITDTITTTTNGDDNTATTVKQLKRVPITSRIKNIYYRRKIANVSD